MMADIWRKILGRKPSEPSNEGGQSKEEGNTRGKRGKKTEEGKKEIGGGANEKGGRNTKKDEEERPSLESGRQKEEEKSKEIEKKTSTGEREGGGRKEIKDAKKEEKEWRFPESGYRIFKFMLFLAGFLTGFFFTYMLCSGYLTEHLSGKFLEHKDQIFLDASVGVGIVAGLLTLCIFYLGLFILGKGGQTPGNYGGQNITGAGNLKDPRFERHLLDIKILAENISPEIEQKLTNLILEMLSEYLANKGELRNMFYYLECCYNLSIMKYMVGCVKITVQCPTLDSLENLWSDTLSGHLDKLAEEYLMTSTIKTKLGTDAVKFKVTIKEEDYLACKMSFSQLSGRQKEEEKSEEIEKKTSTGEREGGGTEEIKDAKKEEKEWRFPESGEVFRESSRLPRELDRLPRGRAPGEGLPKRFGSPPEKDRLPRGRALEELVSEAVLSHINVMDHLKNHLDRSVRGIQNWRYLADLYNVPMEEQLKWGLGEDYSKSEKMFEALTCANPNLHMSVLVQHLKDLNINNVADYIVALKLEANMTVKEFFESPNRNTIGKVLMMLDLMDKEKWWNLGIKIELDAKSLKRINVDCKNRQEDPGSHMINIISTSQPKMTIGQFKKKLENIGLKDIAGKLKKLPEKAMIGKLLENLELAREVTCMLNHSASPGVKYYEDLAAECGIPRETYESLQPPCADSPTQKTIEEIVQRKPNFTVKELFKNLIDMGRLDVIEAIRPYYEEKDVLALERKLKITDE